MKILGHHIPTAMLLFAAVDFAAAMAGFMLWAFFGRPVGSTFQPQIVAVLIFAAVVGIGGDVNYFRSVVDGRGYYPVTPKITLVGRAQAGYISGWGGEDVRMTDLFFKGGETIRGFERAGIGPRDACEDVITGKRVKNCTKDPLGGQAFWATTAELRFPLPFVPDNLGMQGAVFFDAGSLWIPSGLAEDAVADENSFINDGADIRMSSGVSLIWQSPLGPLRADLAQALLKASYDRTELFRFGASTAF